MTYQNDEELSESTKALSKQFEKLFKLTKTLNDEEYFKLMSKIEIYKVIHNKIRARDKIKTKVKQAAAEKPKPKTPKKMKRFKDFLQYLDF